MANHSACINSRPTEKRIYCFACPTCFLIWLLAACLVLFACQSNPALKRKKADAPKTTNNILVPRWYAKLPELPGCRLAHAHSGVYIDKERQKEAIINSGAANLAKSDRVDLEVGWAISQNSHRSVTASFIKEEGWESNANILKENIEILKDYRLKSSVLALVGVCSGHSDMAGLSASIDDSLVNISSDDPPKWVREPLQIAGQYFGVGTAAGYTTVAKAWNEAERQARASLALRLAADYQAMDNNQQQNGHAGISHLSETRAKLTLQNLQVIQHAYSHYGHTFYALVRMPAISH